MCHLYYSAELARTAGAEAFSPALANSIEAEADELYNGLIAIAAALEDEGRQSDAGADLEQLQANARARARGHIAATAFMNVPTSCAVGAAVHDAYTASGDARRADHARHLELLKSLLGTLAERGAHRS
jgi:hypothetical protein